MNWKRLSFMKTPDQEKATADVKKDMEKILSDGRTRVCGDVASAKRK